MQGPERTADPTGLDVLPRFELLLRKRDIMLIRPDPNLLRKQGLEKQAPRGSRGSIGVRRPWAVNAQAMAVNDCRAVRMVLRVSPTRPRRECGD